LRFRKNDPRADCQGALVWSYNDCWGEVGWSVIDHYARPKASYYWLRRACTPIKVLVRCPENHITTRVVNDTLSAQRATVGYGWVRLDGTKREWHQKSIAIPSNGMLEIASIPLPSPIERNPSEWLYAATLSGSNVPEDQAIWLLAPHRQLRMPQPLINTEIHGDLLEVRSPVYCHGVHLDDEGQKILTDNYFDLLPNVPLHIPISGSTDPAPLHLAAVMPLK
jgi:beta-mannosidase